MPGRKAKHLPNDCAPAATVKTITDVTDYRAIFAPKTPALTSVALSGANKLALSIDLAGEVASDVTVSVYRDGVRVAKDLPGTTTAWQDASSNGAASGGSVPRTSKVHSKPNVS